MRTTKWKKITTWFLAITAGVVVIYDAFVAFFNDESYDTVSRVIQALSYDHVFFPFMFGVIFVGHFFIYGTPVFKELTSVFILFSIALLILIADVLNVTPRVPPIYPLILGAVAGRLLWPMTPLNG